MIHQSIIMLILCENFLYSLDFLLSIPPSVKKIFLFSDLFKRGESSVAPPYQLFFMILGRLAMTAENAWTMVRIGAPTSKDVSGWP
jgi:hypothetical protein